MKRRQVTAQDIALAAGFSKTTVCKVLRDAPNVSPRAKRIVRAVAQQMGYRPRASARALARGKTQMIGLAFTRIGQDRTHMFVRWASTLSELDMAIQERGYQMIVSTHPAVPGESNGEVPRMFRETGVDGAVVVQMPGPELSRALTEVGVPYVVLDAEPTPGWFSVSIDERRAAALAVEHLVGLGHRQIGCITATPPEMGQRFLPQPYRVHRFRQFPAGYAGAMAAAGLPLVPGFDEIRPLDELLRAMWQSPTPPSALVAYSDTLVGRIIQWLAGCGLSVPQDVSIVSLLDEGFADRNWVPMPALTCIAPMQKQMAQIAVRTLIDLIKDPETPIPESVILQPQLVIRDSTAPFRPTAG